MRIHHVQLMMPRGREDEALRFYVELLGLPRIPKPRDMPNPEGVWLSLGDQELHLGVQDGEIDRASRARHRRSRRALVAARRSGRRARAVHRGRRAAPRARA